MKPVDQLVMNDPDNGVYGDCQRACIASLLELDPNDVPHFHETNSFYDFDEKMNNFLLEYGLFHLKMGKRPRFPVANIYHMIYGHTERGTYHAVVGKNGMVIHDPHPSKAGLLEEKRDKWEYAFLVPLKNEIM